MRVTRSASSIVIPFASRARRRVSPRGDISTSCICTAPVYEKAATPRQPPLPERLIRCGASVTSRPPARATPPQKRRRYTGGVKVLGFETSCDETAAGIVEDGRRLLANVVAPPG